MEAQINSLDFSRITKEIELLLQQFIRCPKDGVFDKANPYKDLCESCSYEREKILELVRISQKTSHITIESPYRTIPN